MKKITIDNLALMVKKGFDHTDKGFKQVNKRLDNLQKENQLAHEEIKLKLDNVAYRFELEDLEKRVKRLEMKLKIV